jgi:hypothetical protein
LVPLAGEDETGHPLGRIVGALHIRRCRSCAAPSLRDIIRIELHVSRESDTHIGLNLLGTTGLVEAEFDVMLPPSCVPLLRPGNRDHEIAEDLKQMPLPIRVTLAIPPPHNLRIVVRYRYHEPVIKERISNEGALPAMVDDRE